jgi:predicted nucleic acid-binding protein
LHLASAESARADYFLTTDDDLLRKSDRRQSDLKVKVENPAKWLIQETTDENGHAQSR